MTIRDYIYLNQIQTGDTKAHNFEVLDYFKIDYSKMKVKEVYSKVKELTDIKVNDIKKNKIKINGKWFMIERDITKSTFGQFIDLESYLLDNNYLINHLNEVLAIYVRPRKRYRIEKWAVEKKEKNAEWLLDMDINDAFGLNVFFCQNAEHSIKNMKRHYLNKKMMELNQMTKQTK